MSRHFACALSLVAFATLPTAGFAQTNQGVWSAPFNHTVPANWLPAGADWDGEPAGPYSSGPTLHKFMAGHMSLIPVGRERGKVLVWNWMRLPATGKQHWSIIDVSGTPTFQNFDLSIPPADGDLFCSGHAWTDEGHLFVAGGNMPPSGPAQLAYRFDPTVTPAGNAMWVRERDLEVPRWYPTVTALGTDAAGADLQAVTGGYDFVTPSASRNSYEVFDPTNVPGSGTWQVDVNTGSRVFPGPAVSCNEDLAIYPRFHVLGSGKLFNSGFAGNSYRVDHSQVGIGASPTWEIQTANPAPLDSRWYGSSFLFPNLGGPTGGFTDIVVRTGGMQTTWASCYPVAQGGALASVEFCFGDLAQSDPNWIWFPGPAMANARHHHNTVILPDSSVLAIGGNLDFPELVCAQPVLQTELFNDIPFAWRNVAPGSVRRGYHSTAVLLEDGRVLVGGGEQREMDYEIYSPHYLTNGTRRPTILNAPPTLVMNYTTKYDLEYDANVPVERAVLIAPASLTHHSDMHQRYWEMETLPPPAPGTNPYFRFRAPMNANQAPRGYYMLFLISPVQPGANRGTPSVATWVKLQ